MKSFSKIAGFLLVFATLAIQTNPSWTAFNNEDRLIRNIYAPFSKLLDKYLIEKSLEKGGLVTAFDYAKASADSTTESLLGEQNRLLADFDTGQINSRDLALAFWTNAYNYFMIAHILDNPQRGSWLEVFETMGVYSIRIGCLDRKILMWGAANTAWMKSKRIFC
jgi:hypothetical protein